MRLALGMRITGGEYDGLVLVDGGQILESEGAADEWCNEYWIIYYLYYFGCRWSQV